MLSFSFIGVSLSTPEFNVYQSKNKQNYPKYSFSFYVMPVRIIFMLMFKASLISDSIKRSSLQNIRASPSSGRVQYGNSVTDMKKAWR